MEDTHESHPGTPAWDWGWRMDDGEWERRVGIPASPVSPALASPSGTKRRMPRRARKRTMKLEMIRFVFLNCLRVWNNGPDIINWMICRRKGLV